MSKNYCYAILNVDKELCSHLDMTPRTFAFLRGSYDEYYGGDIFVDSTNHADLLLKLREFQVLEEKLMASTITNQSNNFSVSELQLRLSYPDVVMKNDRVNLVARMFSNQIDIVLGKHPDVERMAYVKGFRANGILVGGEFAIFHNVKNYFIEQYFEALNTLKLNEEEKNHNSLALLAYETALYEAEQFKLIIENFGSLATQARVILKNTEGIILGNSVEYSEYANENHFGNNDITELWNSEESIKERFNETNDMKSAYSSISHQTRKLISNIPELDANGKKVVDDLGYTKYLNPVAVHQKLLEICTNITTPENLIFTLEDATKSHATPWIKGILEQVNILNPFNEQLKGDDIQKRRDLQSLFLDMRKGWQIYSTLLKDTKTNTYKTKVLNKKSNIFEKTYITDATSSVIHSEKSIFKKDGKINRINFAKFKRLLRDNVTLPEAAVAANTAKAKANNTGETQAILTEIKESEEEAKAREVNAMNFNYLNKISFLKNAFEYLNLEMSQSEINTIVNNTKLYRNVINALTNMHTYLLSKDSLKLNNFTALYNYKNNEDDRKGIFQENINRILKVKSDINVALHLESRTVHKNSKGQNISLYSHVNPCYMSDFMGRINQYGNNGTNRKLAAANSSALRAFLDSKFGNNPFFKNHDGYRNVWLKMLYQDPCFFDNGFAKNFTFDRELGISFEKSEKNSIDFEDMSAQQHAIQMIMKFFAPQQISASSPYAQYPTFILGDSGVSKFIKAPTFKNKVILEHMYEVFLQENTRMQQAKVFTSKLEELDYSTNKNFDVNSNYYTYLPFLNNDFINSKGEVGVYHAMLNGSYTKENVTKVIEQYLEDSFADYMQNMKNLDVLDKENIDATPFLAKEIKRYKSAEEALRFYFYNHTFANIQQLQIFTVDTAFYGLYEGENAVDGSPKIVGIVKDLQKRYKEIHAPGTVLDLGAVDFNGNRYSGGVNYQTTVYFDDMKTDAEVIHSQFYNAMSNVLDKNPKLRDLYHKNTVSDGQAYRTLKSYRKVMGMAGLWTQKMEDAYNEIQNISMQPTVEEIQRIEDLYVVFQPIKPYMYTMEEFKLNDRESVHIPVQLKYSEAILIPQLLLGNSDLKNLAIWMDSEENGKESIDVVGSTKIVKVGAFGSVNLQPKGQTDAQVSSSLHEIMNTAYVHKLNYEDYRIQTNVPEHINGSQLFGTQIRKLILGRLSETKDYSSYIDGKTINLGKNREVKLNSSKDVRNLYNSLIVNNMIDTFESFLDTIKDNDSLSKMFQQSIISNSRESLDNLLAFAITNDAKFVLPLFESNLEYNSAAMLFSVFKKFVNKQKIKGGSAVQIADWGITSKESSSELKYIMDPKNPNNVLYAECEMPFNLDYKDASGRSVKLKFKDWCNPDGSLILSDHVLSDNTDPKTGRRLSKLEMAYPGILDIVAYRIPTEAHYSMLNLKIVKFSPMTSGGTIKVPHPESTKSGFDFDIDKLYMFKYDLQEREVDNYKAWDLLYTVNSDIYKKLIEHRDKVFPGKGGQDPNKLHDYWEDAGIEENKEEVFKKILPTYHFKYGRFTFYDYKKTPADNAMIDRNNLIMKLMQARLMDPETMESRHTPGGFFNASKDAKTLRHVLYDNVDDLVGSHGVNMQELEERSKSKIDPEPELDASNPMSILKYNQQNQIAGKLIGIMANQNTNHIFSTSLDVFQLRTPFNFADQTGWVDLIHSPEGRNADLTMSELLSASVDAVKDPVLNYLNLNTVTANVGALLARLGYTTEEIGLLFNQPIIKKLCETVFNNGISTSEAISQLYTTYGNVKQTRVKYSENHGSKNALISNILMYRKAVANNKEYLVPNSNKENEGQLAILDLFNSMLSTADELNGFVAATKFTAANAVDSTFGGMYAQEYRVNNYLSTVFSEDSNLEIQLKDGLHTPITNSDVKVLEFDDNYVRQDFMDTLLDNPFAIEQVAYMLNKSLLHQLQKFYPYETKAYKNIRKLASKCNKSKSLDKDTINLLHRQFLTFTLATQNGLFNPNSLMDDGKYTAKEYYLKKFPKFLARIIKLKSFEYAHLDIFKYMLIETEQKNGLDGQLEFNTRIKLKDVGGLDPETIENIKRSWETLTLEEPTLARDLYLYNFHLAGNEYMPQSFIHLAPTVLKRTIVVSYDTKTEVENGELVEVETPVTLDEFLYKIQDNTLGTSNGLQFLTEFVINNPNNRKLVYKPFGKLKDKFGDLYKSGSRSKQSFTLSLAEFEKDGTNTSPVILEINEVNGVKEYTFVPFINLDGVLYRAQSSPTPLDHDFNVSSTNTINYVKVKNKSNKDTSYLSYNTSDDYEGGIGDLSYELERKESKQEEKQQLIDEGVINEDINSIIEIPSTDVMINTLLHYIKDSGITYYFDGQMLMDMLTAQNKTLEEYYIEYVNEVNTATLDSEGNETTIC